jgi:hypothetical protein
MSDTERVVRFEDRAERAPSGPGVSAPAPLVGLCVDARHPSLVGRVRVEIARDGDDEREAVWVPTLIGTVVREGDRVLLMKPANWSEPLVVGVVDGFARRPEPEEVAGPRVVFENDEVVSIEASDGGRLLEVRRGEDGKPAVRVLSEDLTLQVPGELTVDAQGITMRSRRGGVEIDAEDDVKIRGEMIHMN